MAGRTAGTHVEIARLGVQRAGTRAAGAIWRLPLLRWRHGPPFADSLAIIPQDLRSTDPSFVSEVRLGQFGLAGYSADFSGASPFAIRPPAPDWERELHGFCWLRHLRAEGSDDARDMARDLVMAWTRHSRRKDGIAWQGETTGRRTAAWLGNAAMLLEGAPRPVYDAITDSLGEQIMALGATWREAGPGIGRLKAVTALVLARLCIKGHEAALKQILPAFAAELNRQILDDGGHAGRNPAVLTELLLDLLPLRQCFMALRHQIPPALESAIARLMAMVQFLRLGDGGLVRFNGMGASPVDELGSVLAYDRSGVQPRTGLSSSRYARLQQGRTILVIDAGPPPDLGFAGSAHAGCLAFEISAGDAPIFVNGGAPGRGGQDRLAAAHASVAHASVAHASAARATAAHNTLCINGTSSGKLISPYLVGGFDHGLPIAGPKSVIAAIDEGDARVSFIGSHDGYLAGFGMIHTRELSLSKDGWRIEGRDSIGSRDGTLRLARDLPFAIHFHLHPDVACDLENAGDNSGAAGLALLSLASGEVWQFEAAGAQLSIEAGTHFATPSGIVGAPQIVLRGASYGESEVNWTLTRVSPGANPC